MKAGADAARMEPFADHDFQGAKLRDAATMMGVTPASARAWLSRRGWRCGEKIIQRVRLPQDAHDEIHARIAAARPSGPCFRCGAARHCEHR